ncbi:MAG: DUF3089 domain-containing protein [Candidatus Sphingomonas phytovorans]|nr:DUF3089 domain-containing protein [Sphingomonas sp.]WEK00884.1 MAG: DUF3089 domain-containing protein [Sphingomonas sp.]
MSGKEPIMPANASPPTSTGKRRWKRRALWGAGIVLLPAAAFIGLGGHAIIGSLRGPSTAFAPETAPPAPDYARPETWLAFPGRNGLERSTPKGMSLVDEARAPADVFFIHPTTFKGSPVWNARYDASDAAAPYNPPVLIGQASVFNGCCRIYVPRYRQATLAALGKSLPAVELAYSDVARAFRYYLAHENNGRPFIIASHSQGTAHAVRLLQDEILGTPLQSRLVAAYLIGGYTPATFEELGLPTCDAPRATGCVLSYNTSQTGRTGARMLIDDKVYWWRGAEKSKGQAPAICVNPLTWRREGSAPAGANAGSLPFPTAPFGTQAKALDLTRNLTGAVCRNGLLDVDIPWSAPSGFIDKLSILFGSYHLNDYGIFYASLRQNARDRVDAWTAARGTAR